MRTNELFSQRVMKQKTEEKHLVYIELPEKTKQRKERFIEKNQLLLFPESEVSAGINPVSASKFCTYKGCSRAYKYRYVMHLPSPKTMPKAFGSAMHTTIQFFWEKRPDLEGLLKRWGVSGQEQPIQILYGRIKTAPMRCSKKANNFLRNTL